MPGVPVHQGVYILVPVFQARGQVVFVLCGVPGVLQYRWTGEVSLAERERLRGILQANQARASAFSRVFGQAP